MYKEILPKTMNEATLVINIIVRGEHGSNLFSFVFMAAKSAHVFSFHRR